MTKINEILTLDLQEDIKNVIDLEDRSEQEIQEELESYIVTEGIGRHLYDFINQYTSNIKETGVWISGFYGSGKSYFGKMLGYIISNPLINGTPARDRFIPRLKGVSDESLIENSIRKLGSKLSLVVFLDVAKQNTDQGLAFTLFTNLLKTLGFRDDIYGYMEFDLLLDGKYDEFQKRVKDIESQDWNEMKKSNRLVAKVMRSTYVSMDYSKEDYNDTYKTYSFAIENFSASKFKTELEKYLNFRPDETIVFIFDEASEAISQKKYSLLDLEGISEALSGISTKVWTIAIAQEKLDDVINNANVSRTQLTKVTDRFKTKIHLEATEVDVIIRSRLLQKKDNYYTQLINYYNKNEGLVSDATNLKSTFPTKTNSAEEFATYYPFHKYQFDILQKFLFSSNALVATQIAARGMIITTFDVLRKQLRDQELYAFTPGHAICTEAQPAPPVGLVNKYDTACKILREKNLGVDGDKLLKTIHLLSDAEVISPTLENITKSYITDISKYYDIKPKIEEALQLLDDAKVLLPSNNNYKITSDLEGRLLDEMKEFRVELFSKKRFLIKYLKDNKFFNSVATFIDGSDSFKFSVLSDQDDELSSPGNKQLKLSVYSLFNISENRQDFIEQVKLETQYNKDLMTLIPDNGQFSQIDKLINEIIRYTYMEDKYSDETDPEKRLIIRDFGVIREEKEKEFRDKIESAYKIASIIYMYDEHLLNSDTFKGIISDVQRKLVKNIFTKRLSSQLSEGLVTKIFSSRKENLANLFSGEDFRFFDANGNFIGDHLKVIEEINAKITSRFVDGRSLEEELSGPPWGYSFGTIVTSLASLFRAGRLSVKYNGETWFSHDQKAIHEAFTNATKFKSASFKSITATLTAAQKNLAVQILLDLDSDDHTGHKVDWNTNDFDLADSIRLLADHFLGALTTLDSTVENFNALFPNVALQRNTLQEYTGKVTESNYIQKVEYLLDTGDEFKSSIQTILKAQKFIRKNFSLVREYKRFIEAVVAELKKADRSDTAIQDAQKEFIRLYQQDIVNNYSQLQGQAQLVKDHYFKLLKNAVAGMANEYKKMEGKVDAALRDLKKNYPTELNEINQSNLNTLKRYCSERVISEPRLEFSITDEDSGYSLSDVLNYTALVPAKEHELLMIQTGFIKETPEKYEIPKRPRKVQLLLPGKIMKVQEYKSLLTDQLSDLAAAQPDEEIEIDIEIQD
jgi:hypothetical protein